MNIFLHFFDALSPLWEGEDFWLIAAGLAVLILNLCWLLVYLLYGEVLIYNLQEGECYTYLGCRWIERKKGQYILSVSPAMMKRSGTTLYKIHAGRFFAERHEGEPLCIRFGREYETFVPIGEEMIAKNLVATSGKL